MQRDRFEEFKILFLKARAARNFNDMAVWATELLKLDDTLPDIWANRGEALAGLGHPLDAVLNYDRALRMQTEPEARAILHSNKGAAYWDMGNMAKATAALNSALELKPMAQTYMTLGNIYKHQGQLQKAIGAYRLSVDTDPTYADGHLVLGMALLKNGNLQEGWKEYEWRWKTEQLPPRKMKCPQWDGEDLTNKSILVYGEQGLGDIIQFSRYARLLANRFPRCKVIIEGRHPLKRLLETIPEVYAVIDIGDKLPPLDYAVPMLTLAGMLTPNMGAIIAMDKEFLLKDTDVERWEEKMTPLTDINQDAVKIGICWAGMSRDTHPQARAIDELRSTTLNTFAPLAKIPNILWASLQKGPPAAQLKEAIPAGMTVGDFSEDLHDFYETACLIANLDLVIAVDTAVAHVAAAIGKPTWLLSRWDGCWRWFGDREDSPWYPSIRQFVQPAPQDWAGMIEKVAVELEKFVQNKKAVKLDLTLAK